MSVPAAYALVAYQTAYMKAHYPSAFMAANLSAVMDDTDKLHQFRDDTLANGLKLLPPDVNQGLYRFDPVDAKTIRYGLGGVKGTGESAINALIAEREKNGPFTDLFDFCRRIDRRIVNRRAIEALVRAGAFDSIYDHRASLLATVGIAMEAAEQAERAAGQASLFGGSDEAANAVMKPVEAPRWNEPDRLREEKIALGYYFSGHPFNYYRKEISGFVKGTLAELTTPVASIRFAGIIVATRMLQTRRGRMAILLLEDGAAQIEVTAFAETYEEAREIIKEDAPVIIQGKVSLDQFSGSLRVEAMRITDLATARNRFAREMRLSLNGNASAAGAASATRLKKMLEPYRNGNCPVAIHYENDGGVVEMRLPDDWRISPDDNLLRELRNWLQPENVEVLFS